MVDTPNNDPSYPFHGRIIQMTMYQIKLHYRGDVLVYTFK